MKIHIIGGSGSGKSHLAETLSAKYGIPHYDLDELQSDSSGAYGQKRAPEERRRLLDETLARFGRVDVLGHRRGISQLVPPLL